MKKRIVICCDGTWNEPESIEQEKKIPTNVLKMVRAVAARDERGGTDQIIYYDQGIGTGAFGVVDRKIGGGTGYGISNNIRDCYNFIANNYVAGDDIFFFGFSRGAYTVRSLGGMLATIGLLSKEDLRYVPEAYAYYHAEPDKRAQSPFHSLVTELPRSDVAIKFVGVWDTVGALGVPTPILGRLQRWAGERWGRFRVGFHDCNLSDIVENAYQALAIDERRGPFKPSIWDKTTGQRHVLQAWFAGVHSNIGGGYPDAGLSDTALVWMVNRARECGLDISDDYMNGRVASKPLGKLENSYSIAYKALEYVRVEPHLRPIAQHLEVGEMIHESAVLRLQADTSPPYRPDNILGEGDAPALVTEGHRQFLEVRQHRIPVFRERAATRQPMNEADASITPEGQASEPCTIIDFSEAGGARLRVTGAPQAGDRVALESARIGRAASIVVWERDGEVGVRFVA